MRTLTLGVLIVSGGTLAALPFRRYPSAPDVAPAPAALSGPSQSALDTVPDDASVQPSTVANQSLNALPVWNPAPAAPSSRELDIPLTYEDLAMPIEQPAAIEQRLSATASVRDKEKERRRQAALVMPSLDALTLQQREQLETLPSPQESNSEESRAGGQLASATPAEPSFQPLPRPQPDVRQHHWIQQP